MDTGILTIPGERLDNFFSLLNLDWLEPLTTFDDAEANITQRDTSWVAIDIYVSHGNESALLLQLRQRVDSVEIEVTSQTGGRLVESFKKYLTSAYGVTLPTAFLSQDEIYAIAQTTVAVDQEVPTIATPVSQLAPTSIPEAATPAPVPAP